MEKLDKLVMDVVEKRVLSRANVERFMAATVANLHDSPDTAVADERLRLTAMIADLDKRIRSTGAQAAAGVIDLDDAIAMNAPLREQRETARLHLAALPAKRDEPSTDELDVEQYRTAVLEAWTDQPIEERRSALAQLLRKITLTPGGVKITYGYCYQLPSGPPYGTRPVYEKPCFVAGLATPKLRRGNGWSKKVSLVMGE